MWHGQSWEDAGMKIDSNLKFIGHIETPYYTLDECPSNIDPNGPLCQLVIDDEYEDALLGLETGQEILILYWFEAADRNVTRQESRKTGEVRGSFALRSPHRPNPIGAATLPIQAIDGGCVSVRGLDCLDGTRLLDIKPAMMHERSRK